MRGMNLTVETTWDIMKVDGCRWLNNPLTTRHENVEGSRSYSNFSAKLVGL
jgi:hypothetical protein